MFDSSTFRESTLAKEGPLLVSKALKIPVLIDESEMVHLVEMLNQSVGVFGIYFSQGVCRKGEGKISQTVFLEAYSDYVTHLKEGRVPSDEIYRPFFSSFWSLSSNILYAITVENDYQLIKSTRPILQLQLNHIHYSHQDQKFRSMVFGGESITWGIQFSYPQLFQDPKSQDISSVQISTEFPNTILFKQLQKWMRSYTLPSSFIVGGQQKREPIRIGKKCLEWIKKHPQLISQSIGIYGTA